MTLLFQSENFSNLETDEMFQTNKIFHIYKIKEPRLFWPFYWEIYNHINQSNFYFKIYPSDKGDRSSKPLFITFNFSMFIHPFLRLAFSWSLKASFEYSFLLFRRYWRVVQNTCNITYGYLAACWINDNKFCCISLLFQKEKFSILKTDEIIKTNKIFHIYKIFADWNFRDLIGKKKITF